MSPAASPSRSRSAPDAVCAAAVDLARAAAVEEAGDAALVGDHLGASAEPGLDRVVTHRFACALPAYVGWAWAVTVARASRAKAVTVDEVVLLPDSGALLAPEWLPWSERIQPGDLVAGGLLPTDPDDPRLVPSYSQVETPVVPEPYDADLHWALGLGRPRVLSEQGRDEAVERWYGGEPGPDVALARQAPGRCGGCGFLVPLAGALRQVFGVCANAYAPDDARVVSLDHGCGAHSEAVGQPPSAVEQSPPVLDGDDLEVVALAPRGPGAGGDATGEATGEATTGDAGTGAARADDPATGQQPLGHPPGSVDDAEPAEPFGHS